MPSNSPRPDILITYEVPKSYFGEEESETLRENLLIHFELMEPLEEKNEKREQQKNKTSDDYINTNTTETALTKSDEAIELFHNSQHPNTRASNVNDKTYLRTMTTGNLHNQTLEIIIIILTTVFGIIIVPSNTTVIFTIKCSIVRIIALRYIYYRVIYK